ncbi:helix-turn-helix transcriptional regulator [Ligaoa zhengdingensis]|uniref:helix-turn-helix domain-containing protein n=1 Tax=Ligaoa zhengdingensis TaxID=2763658 RepID=UPI0031B9EEEE
MYEHLRGLREDRDLSQKKMADYLQVHQTTYSDYELGNVNIPTQQLIQLAYFFHTSVDYLLGITDEIRPYPRSAQR